MRYLLILILLTSCGKKQQTSYTGQTAIPSDTADPYAVKLCSTAPNSYTSEYALCVNGALYAVYYTGSAAYYTYLPPGPYVTTTAGNNCVFTVVSGCTIKP
jgi:hypothetical protein